MKKGNRKRTGKGENDIGKRNRKRKPEKDEKVFKWTNEVNLLNMVLLYYGLGEQFHTEVLFEA